ncbi:mannitol dehydrogenase family protein [Hoeflea prorocentri]|uniref:Mannitol dehydrogenase family protein n=1 Tax=Hoeflea prorocentri TaxID=1922333 RepID=A0A9X3UMS5_9HYPH|nr:mannitol dehydrogenase family protein [Hoeflea prorocentri]MCY6382069.1 mannitol dehydrogenase family protein [Hoeflea prorocentri]MDA5399869.1 mannitol dehydrogenase family protein [Hoeflea prorocentri]
MDELTPLSDATLSSLPETVRVPKYDRSALTPGIVHIGLGNFHRAHQAWYLHRLFDMGLCQDWSIIGAGVRPHDARQREKLLAQDCLTTLIELDSSGPSAEVIGSMTGYAPVEKDNRALIEQLAEPAIRIVTLTVTEGGYYLDPASGSFDATHPDILHDAANPQAPRTAFGAMVAALDIRRRRGLLPFTGQSCDNLQANGEILRQAVVSLAGLSDPELADWIDTHCSFPNSMVDCIVPTTGDKELDLVRGLGIDDRVPVTHEKYRQWVIEDNFCAGRPDWERVGATITDNVHDYEAMKIRMLNAGHQIIANPGEILSVETISDCMAHPLINGLFRKVQSEEIAPHVKPVPGMTPQDYIDLIDRRFSNPAIVDTTRRVAFDGSARHTGFVLPVLRDGLSAGTPVEGLALVEALWARMCEGTREDGSLIKPNDPLWDELQTAARAARQRPAAWLEQSQFYGDLVEEQQFVRAFERWLSLIWYGGSANAMRIYLDG